MYYYLSAMGRSVAAILSSAPAVEPEIPQDLHEDLVAHARKLGWQHIVHGDLDDAAVYEDFLDGPRAIKEREIQSVTSLSTDQNCPVTAFTAAVQYAIEEDTPVEPLSPSSGVFHPQTLDVALEMPTLPRRRSPLSGPASSTTTEQPNMVPYSEHPVAFTSPPRAPRRAVASSPSMAPSIARQHSSDSLDSSSSEEAR